MNSLFFEELYKYKKYKGDCINDQQLILNKLFLLSSKRIKAQALNRKQFSLQSSKQSNFQISNVTLNLIHRKAKK